jgi:hypothetical protein
MTNSSSDCNYPKAHDYGRLTVPPDDSIQWEICVQVVHDPLIVVHHARNELIQEFNKDLPNHPFHLGILCKDLES